MDATVNHSSAVPKSDAAYAGPSGDAPSPSLAQIYDGYCASAITSMHRLAEAAATPASPAQYGVLIDAARQDLDAIARVVALASTGAGQSNGESEAASFTASDDHAGSADGSMAYIPTVHEALIAAERTAHAEGRKVLSDAYEEQRLTGVGFLEMLAAQAQSAAETLKWDPEDFPSLVIGMGEIERLAASAKLAIETRLQLADLDAQAEATRAAQRN